MRLDDFRRLVQRQVGEVPEEFLDGVVEVAVSPRALPHPTRAGVHTLGECIPLPTEDPQLHQLQSRVVLYYGSFLALAQQAPPFDWVAESWETLTHELRHHMEWRAGAPDLEAFDRAAEQHFARLDGEPFDPDYYRDGEAVAPGVYRIDDDFFLEQTVREPPRSVGFDWHGRRWHADLPDDLALPAFVTLAGVDDPPPGDLVLVLRRKPRLRNLFGLRKVPVSEVEVPARPAPAGVG